MEWSCGVSCQFYDVLRRNFFPPDTRYEQYEQLLGKYSCSFLTFSINTALPPRHRKGLPRSNGYAIWLRHLEAQAGTVAVSSQTRSYFGSTPCITLQTQHDTQTAAASQPSAFREGAETSGTQHFSLYLRSSVALHDPLRSSIDLYDTRSSIAPYQPL